MLDNDELFAVASDTREALTIPELATIGNEEQNLIAPFELSTTPVNVRSQLEVRSQVLPENLSTNFRLVVCSIPEQGQFYISLLLDNACQFSNCMVSISKGQK